MNFPTIIQVPVSYNIHLLEFAKSSLNSAKNHTKHAVADIKSALNHTKPLINKTGALVSSIQNSTFVACLPEKSTVQRIILVITTAFAVLSVIPFFRMLGACALRSTAVISSTANFAESWSRSSMLSRAVKVAKIAAVSLGFVSLIAASPVLAAASLGADIGIQVFETSKAICQRKPENALIHLSAIVIDSFMLAGTLTGSWPFIVTAASISAALMLGLTFKAGIDMTCNLESSNADTARSVVDIMCYSILTGVGIVSAIRVAEIKLQPRTKGYYSFTNKSKDSVDFFDADGKIVSTVKPGETTKFELPWNSSKLSSNRPYGIYKNSKKYVLFPQGRGLSHYLTAYKYDYATKILPAMSAKLFPTVPVGGTAIVTPDL